jgi:hypothetical protein
LLLCNKGLRSEIQTDTGKHTLDRVEKKTSYNGPPTPELFSQGYIDERLIVNSRSQIQTNNTIVAMQQSNEKMRIA